jgi:hypothetical protein
MKISNEKVCAKWFEMAHEVQTKVHQLFLKLRDFKK